jgi:ABC-type sugar transport system substrate-binding protein
MTKKTLIAFLLGYSLRAFQKGWIWRGVKTGANRGFIKAIDKEFPEFVKQTLDDLPEDQREKAQAKLRGL